MRYRKHLLLWLSLMHTLPARLATLQPFGPLGGYRSEQSGKAEMDSQIVTVKVL